MYNCLYCSNELEDVTDKYCRTCRERLEQVNERWSHRPNAPALHGLSDGPGTQELCFYKPDPYRERLAAMKSLEEHGKLNEPGAKEMAKRFVEDAKNTPTPKIDYQVEGHPHFDRD